MSLSGTLAPKGAVLKRAAATPRLLEHQGRAVVFSSLANLAARINSPDLDVAADDILVLQNAGPRSASCMPEAIFQFQKLHARACKTCVVSPTHG